MNRTVIIILSFVWFLVVVGYYSLLTESIAKSGPNGPGNRSGIDATDSAQDDPVVHLPLYFELDKSLPQKGEGFQQWQNELKEDIGTRDTLVITGLYYSGETNGEILATSRSLAVQRLLSEELDQTRLIVDFSQEIQLAGSGLYVKGIRTDVRKLGNLQRMTAQGIRIEFEKGKIKWTAGVGTENKLSEIGDRVKNVSDYSINVIAYTSASGVVDADYELGRKRAWVIKKFLMDKGLDPDRIKTESKGSEEPVSDNAEYTGNDRAIVEIRLNDLEQ